jgi:hypothetical protein
MLARLAAERGATAADVVYSATTTASNPGLFVQIPRIVLQAAASPALLRAVREVEALWTSARAAAPTRVRVAPDTGALELGSALSLELDEGLRLTPDAEALIAALARHIRANNELRLVIEAWLDEELDDADGLACLARLSACAGSDDRVVIHRRPEFRRTAHVALRLESRS